MWTVQYYMHKSHKFPQLNSFVMFKKTYLLKGMKRFPFVLTLKSEQTVIAT